jgi:FtsH-binding integral membrane protein
MKFFRNYTYTWWQHSIIKIAVLALGMITGALATEFVMSSVWLWVVIAAVGSAYIYWLTYKPGTPTK